MRASVTQEAVGAFCDAVRSRALVVEHPSTVFRRIRHQCLFLFASKIVATAATSLMVFARTPAPRHARFVCAVIMVCERQETETNEKMKRKSS